MVPRSTHYRPKNVENKPCKFDVNTFLNVVIIKIYRNLSFCRRKVLSNLLQGSYFGYPSQSGYCRTVPTPSVIHPLYL